jgi:hypothetical protein
LLQGDSIEAADFRLHDFYGLISTG